MIQRSLMFALFACLIASRLIAADPPKTDASKAAAEEKAKPAAEEAEKPATKAKEESKTVKVKAEPMKIELALDGKFEAQVMADVVLRPEKWATLKVVSAVAEGTRVKKGQVIVRLDLKGIDDGIADLRTELKLADLALIEAEAELALLEANTPLDLKEAQRSEQFAREDLKRYLAVDLPMSKRAADFSLKSAKDRLEYQMEELRQLEKMYAADELTEETEEIVLKRARNAVESMKFMVEGAEQDHKQAVEVTFPRAEEAKRLAREKQALAAQRTRAAIPRKLITARIELQKTKVALARNKEKLDKLLADRVTMSVRSPIDGIVYHGQCSRGTWSGESAAADSLREGGSLTAGKVFMTIVNPRPVFFHVAVPEKELHQVTPGLKGTIQPVAFPELSLPTVLRKVAIVGSSDGKFAAQLSVAASPQADAVMPKMTGKATLVIYQARQTLTIPAAALGTEPSGKRRHFVTLPGEDGGQKRFVTIGRRGSEKVEILKGLAEGDEIMAKPAADK